MREVRVIFGVFGYPLASQCFERVHRLSIAPLGIDGTKETADVGLAWFKQNGVLLIGKGAFDYKVAGLTGVAFLKFARFQHLL